ncbi:hypothetical protein JXI42_08945, partial [bacterium]|nr:hypothetical protein [bacterium]
AWYSDSSRISVDAYHADSSDVSAMAWYADSARIAVDAYHADSSDVSAYAYTAENANHATSAYFADSSDVSAFSWYSDSTRIAVDAYHAYDADSALWADSSLHAIYADTAAYLKADTISVRQLFGTAHGSLYVDTYLVTPEVVVDSIESYNGTTILIKDSTYVHDFLDVDGHLYADTIHSDKIYGTDAGTLFVDTFLAVPEVVVDSIESYNGTTILIKDSTYINDFLDVDGHLYADTVHTDKIYGTDAGTLFVDTFLAVPEVVVDSIESYNGNKILVKDTTIFDEFVEFRDDLSVDTIFTRQIFGTANGSLYVDTYLVTPEVVIDSMEAFNGTTILIKDSTYINDFLDVDGHLYADTIHTDKIYGTKAGTLFVDTALAAIEVVTDSIEAYYSSEVLIKDSLVLGETRMDATAESVLVLSGDGQVNWAPIDYIGGSVVRAYGELYTDRYFLGDDVDLPDELVFTYMQIAKYNDTTTAGYPYVIADTCDTVIDTFYLVRLKVTGNPPDTNFDTTVAIDTFYSVDKLLIGPKGGQLYQMNLSISFGAPSGVWLQMAVCVNKEIQKKFVLFSNSASAGEIKSSSLSGLIRLDAGDEISVIMNNRADTENPITIEIRNFNIQITRVNTD